MTENNQNETASSVVNVHDVVEQATDIFTMTGREAFRVLEEAGQPGDGYPVDETPSLITPASHEKTAVWEAAIEAARQVAKEQKIETSSGYGYWDAARTTRRDLVSQLITMRTDVRSIPAEVTTLANFIENGGGATPKELETLKMLEQVEHEIASVDDFLQENFPKEYAQRDTFASLVISLLEKGYGIPADTLADDEDED